MKDDLPKIFISDASEMGLLSIPDEKRKSLGDLWSSKDIKTSNLNNLQEILNRGALLLYQDIDRGEISYIEALYYEIIFILKKLGISADIMRRIKLLFKEDYSPGKSGIYGIRWLDILLCVYCGQEMEIFIEGKNILICDPPSASSFATNATLGQIRLSISAAVNKLNSKLGIDQVRIKRNFGDLPLNTSEIDVVIESRNLKSSSEEKVEIAKTSSGKTLVKLSKILEVPPNESDAMKLFKERLLEGKYSDLQTIKRDGRIVKIKEQTQKLYD